MRKAVLDEKNCAVLCIGVCNLRESVIAVNNTGYLSSSLRWSVKYIEPEVLIFAPSVIFTEIFLSEFLGLFQISILSGGVSQKPLEEYVVP